jgi:hypothetical protein
MLVQKVTLPKLGNLQHHKQPNFLPKSEERSCGSWSYHITERITVLFICYLWSSFLKILLIFQKKSSSFPIMSTYVSHTLSIFPSLITVSFMLGRNQTHFRSYDGNKPNNQKARVISDNHILKWSVLLTPAFSLPWSVHFKFLLPWFYYVRYICKNYTLEIWRFTFIKFISVFIQLNQSTVKMYVPWTALVGMRPDSPQLVSTEGNLSPLSNE